MEYLTVKEVAELKNVSEQYIRKLIASGQIETEQRRNPSNGHMQYVVSVEALPEELQKKYYASLKKEIKPIPIPKTTEIEQRSFEEMSAEEREKVVFWSDLLDEWQHVRNDFESKAEANTYFILDIKRKYPELNISEGILYRKYAAYREGNIEGLLDHRGGHNAGTTSIPNPVWQAFSYYFLDDRRLPVTQCYEITMEWTETFYPEYVAQLPTERTFRRRISTIPGAVIKLCRYGEKALVDECLPFISREYSELEANDVWVADNHTIDVITRYDDTDKTHRVYITAFMDAKSGVITGWNITDNPCSNSTIFALRHGIERFGIPKMVYFDNGTEFLTLDIAGRGHRTRKSQLDTQRPPAILSRLGIEMRNAMVRNARAKPVERFFLTFKNSISKLFETYTGGNVLEKPESLKKNLKAGQVPLDSRLREVLNDLIDGIYNVGTYGGAEKARFKDMSRLDVWNATIIKQRKATADDLNLMLMRTTQYQKIKRNGVMITISGQKLWYSAPDTWNYLDQEVYVRYDPTDLSSVRLYDKEDKFMFEWQLESELRLKFMEPDKDKISTAQAKLRRTKTAVKEYAKGYISGLTPDQRIDALDLRVRQAQRAKEGMLVQEPKQIVPVRANETAYKKEAVGQTGVVIDMNKMNRNAEKRRK